MHIAQEILLREGGQGSGTDQSQEKITHQGPYQRPEPHRGTTANINQNQQKGIIIKIKKYRKRERRGRDAFTRGDHDSPLGFADRSKKITLTSSEENAR